MGRSLAGNSVSPVTTTLSRTLGNLSANIRDNSLTASSPTILFGTHWVAEPSSAFGSDDGAIRNSVAEQRLPSSRGMAAIQDPLSDYTYVQGPAYYGNSGGVTGIVYDADLNQIYGWGTGPGAPAAPFSGTLFCVRLYNSVLYFFSSTTSGVDVTRVSLPSGTVTTSSSAALGGSWSQASTFGRVFNWVVNNKFWIYATTGSSSPYASVVWTFDVTTNTIAQFGTTLTRGVSNYISNTYAMHVNAAGTAVSVAAYSVDATYGVANFTSSSSAWNGVSSNGHISYGRNGSWRVFCNSSPNLCAVTTDFVVDTSLGSAASGAQYYNNVYFMQGGSAVFSYEFTGTQDYTYPIASISPNPSLTTRDQIFINFRGTSGIHPVSLSGATFVVGTRRSAAFPINAGSAAIASKLPDPIVISANFLNELSATAMSINQIRIMNQTETYSYSFSTSISGHNSFGVTNAGNVTPMSFVTSTGRLFMCAPYKSEGGRSIVTVVTGLLPVFTSPVTKTYNFTVIGGGGGAATVDGGSSAFSGASAANGTTRVGANSGTTVFTSGPSVGTGGAGYGADRWGQGEDTTAVGAYGGGSGYVVLGTATLTGGIPYPYRAGLGSQYGKQGAVLLTEV